MKYILNKKFYLIKRQQSSSSKKSKKTHKKLNKTILENIHFFGKIVCKLYHLLISRAVYCSRVPLKKKLNNEI